MGMMDCRKHDDKPWSPLTVGKKMSFVIVKGDRIPTEQVEFLNIEEDFDGADLMTFNYDGEQYKSRVYGKSF